jgi:hypothetical protein
MMMLNRYFTYNRNGIKIPGIKSGIRIEYFLTNNEQKNWMKTKVEQKMNKVEQ